MKPILESGKIYSVVRIEELDHTQRRLRIWIKTRRNKKSIQKVDVVVKKGIYHYCDSCPFIPDCMDIYLYLVRCKILEAKISVCEAVEKLYGISCFVLEFTRT